MSPCGREKNYIRCDDLPIVYTHLISEKNEDSSVAPQAYLSYGYAGDKLKVPFHPEKLYMHPETGRVYHPGPDKVGGVGLIKSKLAIELSQNFMYENDDDDDLSPSHYLWHDKPVKLTCELHSLLASHTKFNPP